MNIPDGEIKVLVPFRRDNQTQLGTFSAFVKASKIKLVLEEQQLSQEEFPFPSRYIYLNPDRLQRIPKPMMGAGYTYQDQVDWDSCEQATQ